MNATLAATMDSHDEGLFHVYERLLIQLLDNKDTLFVQVLLHHFTGLSCRGQRLHSRAWPGHCVQVKPTNQARSMKIEM